VEGGKPGSGVLLYESGVRVILSGYCVCTGEVELEGAVRVEDDEVKL
jgi:hypothetical protein